jgi:AcrR family transcriptional regulator
LAKSKRTREEPAVRRSQILDEALGLIAERGFNGFTIQQLSSRCGMSNAGLLHYFASKDELLSAVLGEIERREAAELTPLVEAIEAKIALGSLPIADVLMFFRQMAGRLVKRPNQTRFLLVIQAEAIDPGHPANAYFRSSEAIALGLFERVLATHVDDLQLVARCLHAALTGLAQQWLRSGEAFDLLETWDRAMEIMVPKAS